MMTSFNFHFQSLIGLTVFTIQFWWCKNGEFGIGSTSKSPNWYFLHCHHLPTWYYIDILRRNSALVTHKGLRVNMWLIIFVKSINGLVSEKQVFQSCHSLTFQASFSAISLIVVHKWDHFLTNTYRHLQVKMQFF